MLLRSQKRAGVEEDAEKLWDSDTYEEDEPSAFSGFCCLKKPWPAVILTSLGLLILGGFVGMKFLPQQLAQNPTWVVKSLVIEHVDIPGLAIADLIPADTSSCSPLDPCGIAKDKGCSRCPEEETMWNYGCICKPKHGNETRKAPPGSVVKADTSTCPLLDACGLFTPGCAKCPDDSWTNDGCFCHQRVTTNDFMEGLGTVVKGVEGFLGTVQGTLTGQPVNVVKMSLMAHLEVYNPNFIGAHTEDGVFHIKYRGFVIGSAGIEPLFVEAHNSSKLDARVEVDKVPADVGMMMVQELLREKNQLNMEVEGTVTAKVETYLTVHCTALCKLRTDVARLQAPNVSFSRQECSYGYSM